MKFRDYTLTFESVEMRTHNAWHIAILKELVIFIANGSKKVYVCAKIPDQYVYTY